MASEGIVPAGGPYSNGGSVNDVEKGQVEHRNPDFRDGANFSRYTTAGGHTIDTSQPAFPVYHRKLGNPSPLGLMSFAASAFVASLYILQVRGITHPNAVVVMAFAYAALAQMITGIQEWICGNTFGATVFTTYGCFWLSYSMLFMPQFDVAAAYTDPVEYSNALGIYLCSWAIVTIVFLIAALKSSIALCLLLFFLDIFFWTAAAGYMTGSRGTMDASGAFAMVAGAFAAYIGLAGLLTPDTSYFTLPVGDLSRSKEQKP